jgi:lysophospholipase L1-like esterase
MEKPNKANRIENVRYAIFLLVFTLVTFEVLLREMHINESYTELIGHGFVTYYGQRTQNIYNTNSQSKTFVLDNGDFKYPYTTNELGLREKSVNEFANDTAPIKIVALGDSYTEGVGAVYDSSWPRQLEYMLKGVGKNVSVYDAGSSGSDPFFECKLYDEQLKKANPDLVIMCLNASDISDYIFRGGDERFIEKGWVKYKPAPWYEPLYHYLFTARFLLTNILGLKQELYTSPDEYYKFQEEFVKVVSKKIIDFNSTLGPGTKLLVILLPMTDEIAFNKLPENVRQYKVLKKTIDEVSGIKNIQTLDMFNIMAGTISESTEMEYTYKHDKHFNAKGYNMVAQYMLPCVAQTINKNNLDTVEKTK